MHGYAFATDRRILLDLSTTPERWEPEFWTASELPFAQVLFFGPSRLVPEYLQLTMIDKEDDGSLCPEPGNVHFAASSDVEFWQWYQTTSTLMKRNRGAEARPEYQAWIAAHVARVQARS